MAYTVEIKGLREVIAHLDSMDQELKKRMNGQMTRGAQVFVAGAKRDAPKDFGFLAGQISFAPNPVVNMTAEMISGAFYSPYMEWGTITHVSVPPEEQSYAIEFKGKGIRKTGGIFPHPFFFKQLPLMVKTIETGMQAELNGIKL